MGGSRTQRVSNAQFPLPVAGFRVHCRVGKGEGILSMAIDAKRQQVSRGCCRFSVKLMLGAIGTQAFFLTWPSGFFGTCALLPHTRKVECDLLPSSWPSSLST